MSLSINETHDPALRSWVESANAPGADFPIQNLPFGAFLRPGHAAARIGAAIGDQALDLEACVRLGLLDELPEQVRAACQASALNPLMALGPESWSALRLRLSRLLRDGAAEAAVAAEALVPQSVVELLLPAQIGDYTDFYASIYHATNVGSMFRPDNPLLPNYKYVPIGYHGRASSIVASGAPVRRPAGQLKGPQDEQPVFAPCKLLDYEAEIGFFVGPGNAHGERIAIGEAERHIFGLCLVNDWSARDIQTWEYQPLGPFLAKSFATSLSPWVVTLEALAPFRAPAFARPAGDPAPLPYLSDERDAAAGGLAITIEMYLSSQAMRERGEAPARISRGSFRDMYWTIGQLLAHHASNGCNLRPGDLLASGTVSGSDPSSRGCLLELTWRGAEPITLPDGEERRFLQDGDEVTMRGFCAAEGFAPIGFGACSGLVLPARDS